MTVTHNGGTFSHEPMATDGTPFITASQCATLVSMPPILVAEQPSSIGETVPTGTRPVILSSTGSGVKSECRLVLWALVAGMDVLVIERYGEYIRVAQRDRLARGTCQVKNRVWARRETSLAAAIIDVSRCTARRIRLA